MSTLVKVTLFLGLLTAVATLWWRLRDTSNKRSREWWTRQIVIVTGSSSGLGHELVKQLLVVGCGSVVCVDLNKRVQDTTNFSAKTRIIELQGDVGSQSDVKRMVTEIRKEVGHPTILISNAGAMVGKKVLDLNEGQFERTMAVNFLGTYYWIRELLPNMIQRKEGRIVATASIMSYVGISQLSDYVASKHALIGFIESLRYELDKKYQCPGIATTLLILGQMKTPLFERVQMSPLASLLSPVQDPSIVAKDVVRTLGSSHRHNFIFRPRLARLAPAVQALPLWLRDTVQWLSGADEALRSP